MMRLKLVAILLIALSVCVYFAAASNAVPQLKSNQKQSQDDNVDEHEQQQQQQQVDMGENVEQQAIKAEQDFELNVDELQNEIVGDESQEQEAAVAIEKLQIDDQQDAHLVDDDDDDEEEQEYLPADLDKNGEVEHLEIEDKEVGEELQEQEVQEDHDDGDLEAEELEEENERKEIEELDDESDD